MEGPVKTSVSKPSSVVLTEVNARAMASYKEMRAQVVPSSGADAARCETVLAMQLAVRGYEVPFKVHAMRAMGHGVALTQLESLLMAGVGVSLLAFEAARAVEWARQAHDGSAAPRDQSADAAPEHNSN